MSEESAYAHLLSRFDPKRRELLQFISELVPSAVDMHKRRWRVQLLDNAISDVKETLVAMNNQIDTERAQLDELNSQTDRLRAQEAKLLADVKILQGVTGMKANLPQDGTCIELDSINEMFRPRPEWNNILECIYGDYNKWLEIHWISIVNGEITMVLKLTDPRTIMVTSERRQ